MPLVASVLRRLEAIGPDVDGFAIGDHVVLTLIKSCGECRNCRKGASVACVGEQRSHPTPLSDGNGAPVAHGLGTGAFVVQHSVLKLKIKQWHTVNAVIRRAPWTCCSCATRSWAASVQRRSRCGSAPTRLSCETAAPC